MPPLLRARYERLARRLTLSQLATLSDLNTAEISLIENGRLIPSTEQLDKLAKAFSISPASVLLKPVTVRDPEEIEAEAQRA